jgi:outer membrane protein assembly factor BamB
VNWTFTTGDSVTSGPVIDADGSIFVGSVDDNLYKLDPLTGVPVWNFTSPGEIDSATPLIWGSLVIFGCDDDNVYAVNKITGVQAWSYTTQVRSHPDCLTAV